MSQVTTSESVSNKVNGGGGDGDGQPDIRVEERRLKLDDFLKTAIKIDGSDVHLQATSVPMIRV